LFRIFFYIRRTSPTGAVTRGTRASIYYRLRDLVGADRKISSFAGMGVGRVQERIERRDIDFNQNIFDVALQKTHQMYPHLSRNS
jgi:hypothetical protein